MKRENAKAYLYLLITTATWGSVYVVSKFVMDTLPVFTLLFLRYAIGATFLFFLYQQKKRRGMDRPAKLEKGDGKYILIVGVIGYFIGIGLQLVGTHLCTASLASLINSTNPVIMVLIAVPILKERATLQKLIAVGITVVGAAIIIGNIGGGSTVIGIIASIGSVLAWSISSIYVRLISKKYDVLMITVYGMAMAAVLSLPIAVWELAEQPITRSDVRISLVLSVLYIGLVSTAGALLLWNKALSMVTAATCSLFYPVQPLVATFLGVLLLGEPLTINFILGGLLVIGGIVYAMLPFVDKSRAKTNEE